MIKKSLCYLALVCVGLLPAQADPTTATVDAGRSEIVQDAQGTTVVRLGLSQGVPFRVFTLAAPARLVIDFREADWSGVTTADLLLEETVVEAVRFGSFQPGWSRLVADLGAPVLPRDVALKQAPGDRNALLELQLQPVSTDEFMSKSGAPADALWPDVSRSVDVIPQSDDRFVVVIDPGHGGIDPGAERDGVSEKGLMLDYARALRDVLDTSEGVDVVMTRDADVFVSLQNRVAQAHRAQGDLFVSLHADSLSQGGAQGATVYTLSEEASDKASAYLAARHNRSDILAGLDLSGADDEVARVLLDLARQETEPRSGALADALVKSIGTSSGPLNRRPIRRAGFSVLKSADIPSVLVEVGFLSSQRDLENIRDPDWQSRMVDALAQGILSWRAADDAQRALVLQ